jgi:hypothetical protein
MNAWRSIIVGISLGQIAAGVACLVSPSIPDGGLFGFTLCTLVGVLGLLTQGTGLLRPAAVAANVTLAMLFLPALVTRIIVWLDPAARSAGNAAGFAPDVIAAGMVLGGLVSARVLWRSSNEAPGREVASTAAPSR